VARKAHGRVVAKRDELTRLKADKIVERLPEFRLALRGTAGRAGAVTACRAAQCAASDDRTLANRPGVKVLVTTGDSARTDIPETVGSILGKPYTGRDLLERVKQALAKQTDDETARPPS
jgi:hypothetical protein